MADNYPSRTHDNDGKPLKQGEPAIPADPTRQSPERQEPSPTRQPERADR